MMKNKIGIIGGSGLDDPDILINPEEADLDTPYGKTSDKLLCGKIGNTDVVVLARHAKGHSISPTKVPYLGAEGNRLHGGLCHDRLRFSERRNETGRFDFYRSVY